MYTKYRIKLRLTYNYTLQEYDGLYYFGLDDEEYKLVQFLSILRRAPCRRARTFPSLQGMRRACVLRRFYQ